MVGLDGLLVALERIVRLVECRHGGLELGANALHVKVLGRMQQLMAPLVSELNGASTCLTLMASWLMFIPTSCMGSLLLYGAIWWFRFYYARLERRRIRKRVRVRLTRTRSLGAGLYLPYYPWSHTLRLALRRAVRNRSWTADG